MASLIAKEEANKLYYYVVESARVDGKPRIVHQERISAPPIKYCRAGQRNRTAPVPLEATALDVGLPGALWIAAQQTGVFEHPPIPLAATTLRSITCAFSACWPRSIPSASTRSQNRSGGLVWSHHPALAVGLCAGTIQFAGVLGPASTASRRTNWNKRRFVFSVCGKQKQLVGRRLLAYDDDQLLYLCGQHQYAERTGPARTQQARPPPTCGK